MKIYRSDDHVPYRRYVLGKVRKRRWWRLHISGDALCWLAGLGWLALFLALAWMRNN